ncbi:MAG: hypothetical protein ACXQT4_02300 [Methanotrichaceae archaeon]
MRLLLISAIVFLFVVQMCTGSYGIDYYLGSHNDPSREDSFHGAYSAKLAYGENKHYIRIDLEEPLPFEDLDEFTMQILPLTENGKIGIDLYLDGNGDGKWKSGCDKDVKLYARINSWVKNDCPTNQWTKLGVFDLNYKKSYHTNLGTKSLTNWQEESPDNLNLVKIYIRLYSLGCGICLIDYLKIADYTLSFEPFEDSKMKKGKPSKVSPGGKITYTITYGNDNLNKTFTNLKVVEHYDPRTTFISADPQPDSGTNNVWTIGTVSPGRYGQIKIVMKARKQNFDADINGRVSGSGCVSVRRKFSTERNGHVITNKATISCDQFNQDAIVKTVMKPIIETSVTFVERGSGDYSSSEDLTYRSYKMIMEQKFKGNQFATAVNLSTRCPLVYNTSWYASHVCENQKRRSLLSERFLQGDRMNCSSSAEVRSTRMVMESESNFSGLAVYEVGSDTKRRRAILMNILHGNFSSKTCCDIYK